MSFKVDWISDEKERGLVACKPIQEGEVIFSENPIVCAQYCYNSLYFPACSFCLKNMETPSKMLQRLTECKKIKSFPNEQQIECLTCEKCFEETYCSTECRDQAWDAHHSILCFTNPSLIELIEYWKSFSFPPESATITFVIRLYALVLSRLKKGLDFDEAMSPFNSFKFQYFMKETAVAIKFLEEEYKSRIEELFRLIRKGFCSYISSFPELFTIDIFRYFMSIMSLNGQGIGTSSLESYKQTCDEATLQYIESFDDLLEEHSGEFTYAEGTGIYSMHANINHSCDPNSQIIFLEGSSKLSVSALRDIKEGEEICISYICCDDMDFSERQELLLKYYLFSCSCPACISEQ